MYRNTYLLISALAVVAALVIGINIGRQSRLPDSSLTLLTPTPSPLVTSAPLTQAPTKGYRNVFCRVGFDYPSTFTLLESATGSAAFTGPGGQDGMLLTCQKDIPRPAVTQENIEDIRIGSVSAKLYHTQSAKDGTAIDSLIFRHPGTKLDVFLASTDEFFRTTISTITLLP
ncbi:hypothetical protein HY411_02765 [Candidatus Gottesmanbacteria bacterium]|nr:hypothetical protein [Candidatus Gottesmanbacteria bacterium]